MKEEERQGRKLLEKRTSGGLELGVGRNNKELPPKGGKIPSLGGKKQLKSLDLDKKERLISLDFDQKQSKSVVLNKAERKNFSKPTVDGSENTGKAKKADTKLGRDKSVLLGPKNDEKMTR